MLTAIQTTQKFMLERLEAMGKTQVQHEDQINAQRIVCEGRRQELTALAASVGVAQQQLKTHEEFLQQIKGSWRATVVISSIVSALISFLGPLAHSLLGKQ
jgi:hypothetical protein